MFSVAQCRSSFQQMECQKLCIVDHANILDSLYSLTLNDSKYENQFFECFPTKFGRFDSLYGYHPKNSELGILFEYSDDHIYLIYYTEGISEKERFDKLVQLSFEGKWEADAIGYFQHLLLERMKEQTSIVIDILSKYETEKIYSFWYFLFDGPHPGNYKNDVLQLHGEISQLQPQIANLLYQAYDDLISNYDGHGH